MTVLRADIIVNSADALANIAAVRQSMREAYTEMSAMSARPMSAGQASAEIARGNASRARDEARRAADEARYVGRAWREEYRSIDQIAGSLSGQMVDAMRGGWEAEQNQLRMRREQLNLAYEEARVRATIGAVQVGFGAAILGYSTKAYSEFQRFEVGLTSLLGEQRGGGLAKEMNQFAVQSAYSATEVRRISQMMLALGFEAEGLRETMGIITNLTAMSGGDSNQMYRLALALSQVKNMGGLRGQERNQLAQAGVPLELVAQKMGITMKGLMESRGSITYEQLFGALKAIQADRGDLQSKLSMSNPQVASQNFFDAMALALKPAGEVFSKILLPVILLGTSILTFVGNLDTGIAAAIVLAPTLWMMARGIREVIIFFRLQNQVLKEQGIEARGLIGTFVMLNRSALNAAIALNGVGGASQMSALGSTAAAGAASRMGAGASKVGMGAAMEGIPVWGQIAGTAMIIWGLYEIVSALTSSNSSPSGGGGTLDGQPMNRADMIEGMSRLDWKAG